MPGMCGHWHGTCDCDEPKKEKAVEKEQPIKMFFWSEEDPPSKFVNLEKSIIERLALAGALGLGKEHASYRGMATCRIKNCGKTLGNRDMFYKSYDVFGKTFIFPQQCEHYVLAHGVWVPEADEFLQAVVNSYNTSLTIDIALQMEDKPRGRRTR